MRNDILEKKDLIIEMINNNESKSSICKVFQCKPITLENYLKKLNITYIGNRGLRGKKSGKNRKPSLYYSNNDIIIPSSRLRKKLIEDGVKKDSCELCNLTEWLGQKIPLELHHIDGNRFNNKIENLQILCPNCHSLTHNHSTKKTIISSNSEKIINNKRQEKINNLCSCGKIIKRRSKKCFECYSKSNRKIDRPLKENLIQMVNEIGYCAVGRKFGVSDNAIRKWIK
jgi:hypothetical protein